MNKKLDPLFRACFIETNPIPIKTSLAMKGMCSESFRLPMCTMEQDNREKLKNVLNVMNLI